MYSEMDMRPIVGSKMIRIEAARIEKSNAQQDNLLDLSSDNFKPLVGARLIKESNQR